MPRIQLDEDIRPLSEFRANVSSFVEKVRTTKRPVVLTQRGHSAAVLLDVTEYDRLLDELEVLRDIHVASKQLADGEGVPHERARREVLARVRG